MSDLVNNIKQWVRKMGYDGDIPESLNQICNPSTAFIWEQLLSNVKPKQEVANIRRNIIVHRLKQKPLSEQSEFDHPIKEIDVFLKKQTLEKKVTNLEHTIEEKEMLVDELLEKNKKTYVKIGNIKAKIKENSEKKFLLERKRKMLEDDLHKAEDVLTLARNLTPVEMDENTNENDITETLQKCAEKLYKLTEELPFTTNLSNMTAIRPSLLSSINTGTPRNLQQKSSLSEFTNEFRINSKIKGGNKENVFVRNVSLGENVKECSKEEATLNNSLCLLPNTLVELCDDFDDVFLSKASSSQTECSFMKTSLNRSYNRSSSLHESRKYDIFEKLRDNQHVKDMLRSLLYNNNRQLIINCCHKMFECLLAEIKNSTMEYNKANRPSLSLEENDLNDLYLIHIKNELEKEKHQAIVRKLQENVRIKKEKIYATFSQENDVLPEQKRRLELELEDLYLTISNNFLRQKIEALKHVEVVDDDFQTMSVKIQKIKDEILVKSKHIKALIGNIHTIFQHINKNREETSSYVRSITIFNLSMAMFLNEEWNSKEIQVFENFPLEYNRRFLNNDMRYFYRNVSDCTVPSYIDLDSNDLERVTAIIDAPFSPAESVAVNTLRQKIKLNMLKSFQKLQPKSQSLHHSYTTEELVRHEEYIRETINKLNFMINSSSVKEVLSAPSHMQEVADLWTQMPFRNFLAEDRMVDGQNYKFYEKMFENLYNNF